MAKTIVIIGGGIAGVSAAEEIRAKDEACEIFIIEREHNPLYSRVLLPHYIKGVIPREKVFLKSETWYGEKNITYLTGTEAEEISPAHQFIRITGGRELSYSELIITTGTRPRLLRENAQGVHYLYTLSDADAIKAHVERMTLRDEALVYGGGFIACEFINLLAKAGKKPKVLLRGRGFWSKALLKEGQEFLENILTAEGVDVQKEGGEIELVTESDTLRAVKDQHGKEYPAAFLGVGIGAELETELATNAHIAVDEGIIAAENLRTSEMHVYTAGDVAQTTDAVSNRSRIHGNWAHAQQEGRKAGKVLRGESPAPLPLSQYTTELLGCKIAFLGDVQKDAANEVRILPDQLGYTQIFLRENILVGAVLLGNMTDRMRLAGMIGKTW